MSEKLCAFEGNKYQPKCNKPVTDTYCCTTHRVYQWQINKDKKLKADTVSQSLIRSANAAESFHKFIDETRIYRDEPNEFNAFIFQLHDSAEQLCKLTSPELPHFALVWELCRSSYKLQNRWRKPCKEYLKVNNPKICELIEDLK